ncbi:MAG TPA: hypothetical protein PLQ81_09365, partial [bacterium]|nr:hypothetical protein [bacterium]
MKFLIHICFLAILIIILLSVFMFQGGVILYPFIFDSIILSFIFASLLTIIVLYKKKMSDKLLLFIKYFNIVFSV